jgi:hypothetical protein
MILQKSQCVQRQNHAQISGHIAHFFARLLVILPLASYGTAMPHTLFRGDAACFFFSNP